MPTNAVPWPQALPEMLNVQDMRRFLRVSLPTAYALTRVPGFPVMKLGRTIRVPRSAFLQWIAEQHYIEPGEQ